jgi:hypothetical protein
MTWVHRFNIIIIFSRWNHARISLFPLRWNDLVVLLHAHTKSRINDDTLFSCNKYIYVRTGTAVHLEYKINIHLLWSWWSNVVKYMYFVVRRTTLFSTPKICIPVFSEIYEKYHTIIQFLQFDLCWNANALHLLI